MSADEDALLAAAHAAPDDDLPRLVFADWLDEHGHSEQAAFIRVQCETARCYAGHRDEPLLSGRLSELPRPKWYRDSFPPDGIRYADGPLVFEPVRGLPGGVDVHLPGRFLDADAAAAWPPTLEAMHFDWLPRREWSADDVRRVFASPTIGRLRTLSLNLHNLDPRAAAELFASPSVCRLETLSLRGVSGGVVAALTSARMPSLRRLRLRAIDENDLRWSGGPDDECELGLDRLPFLGQLEELSLDCVAVGRGTFRRLFRDHDLPRLRSLRLQAVNALRGEGVRELAGRPWAAGVVALHVGSSGLDDDDLGTLCRSPHLTGLHTLWLRSNKLTSEGVTALARSPVLGGVARLNLRANFSLDDVGVTALAASPLAADLRELNLGFTDVNDPGLVALAASPHLEGLRRLDLGCNQGRWYGDVGGLALARSPRLRNLESLTVSSGGLSPACEEALRQRYGPAYGTHD